MSTNRPSNNLKSTIYRTIILPFVLSGYESGSITLREESGLRLFENSVLRRMFWPKGRRKQGGGDNCIMRNFGSERLTQYCSGDKIEKIEMDETCSA